MYCKPLWPLTASLILLKLCDVIQNTFWILKRLAQCSLDVHSDLFTDINLPISFTWNKNILNQKRCVIIMIFCFHTEPVWFIFLSKNSLSRYVDLKWKREVGSYFFCKFQWISRLKSCFFLTINCLFRHTLLHIIVHHYSV